jgi:hypothetical protein
MNAWTKALRADRHWRWWVLYLVPLVPIYFLDGWLLHGHGWKYWTVWGCGLLAASVTASRLEKYWPKRQR